MTVKKILLLAMMLGFAGATSEELRGENVCLYEDKITSTSANDSVLEDYEPLLIKKCCVGYETTDGITCQRSVIVDPLGESRFTLALGTLFFALAAVAALSMLVAYLYHYRHQNRSHRVMRIDNANFEESARGVPNLGFTYTEKSMIPDEKFVPDLQLR